MAPKGLDTTFFLRAEAVRMIVRGLSDKTERETLLLFVEDAEKLAHQQLKAASAAPPSNVSSETR